MTYDVAKVLASLDRHIMQMAPHQKSREQGRLIIESRDVIRQQGERIKQMEAAHEASKNSTRSFP